MPRTEIAVTHFIDGDAIDAGQDEMVEVWEPATGDVLALAPVGTAADVERAVASAHDGFKAWSHLGPGEQERILHEIAQRVERERERLAALESANTGKRLDVALGEVDAAVAVLRFYAGYPTKNYGEHIAGEDPELLCYTVAEPLGVIAAITAWNYPLMITTIKVAAALAAGCSVVVKPAPETPLTAVELARLAHEAGLPAGTLNVVTGDGRTGSALAGHPGVAKVTFTGSTATGRKVLMATAASGRATTMELGGKNPNVVFSDVDPAAAIDSILMGALTNAGQECCAGARVLVHESVFDEFVERAAVRIDGLRVGIDHDSEVGPLITAKHRDRVAGFVDRAIGDGATIRAQAAVPDEGFYYPPTLLVDVRPEIEACREEIFGPVITVDTFVDDDDALRKANDTPYGLAAGIWTASIGRALRFSRSLEAGRVWVNSYLTEEIAAPFGGTKDSGFGREMGLEGPREFSQLKTVYLRAAPSAEVTH